MRKIRDFYLSKTPRERFMLVALLWVSVFIWMTYSMRWQNEISQEKEVLQLEIDTAQSLIANKDLFVQQLTKVGDTLDLAKAVGNLPEELEKMLMDIRSGQKSMTFANDTVTAKMTVKTVKLTISNVSMRELVKFENKILERSPYISLSKADFSSDTKGNMTARYEVSSFIFNNKK